MWIYLIFAAIPVTDLVELPPGISYEVAGFIRRDDQDSFYLVSQPEVKSCCLGKGKEVEIKLKGLKIQGSVPSHAVTVSGILERDQDKMVINEGRILERAHSTGVWLSLIAGGAVIIYALRRLVKF